MRSQEATGITLVVNPAAGRGRAGRALSRIVAQLRQVAPQAPITVERTASYDESVARCRAAVERAMAKPDLYGDGISRDLLVVVGGDGMAHIGINACAATPVPLAIIPAGTGNDFCRGLGIPLNLRRAPHTAAHGTIDTVDLNRVTGDLADGVEQAWVGCTVSTGYDAVVSQAVRQSVAQLGTLTYVWHALHELARFSPMRYQLTIDGQTSTQQAMVVAVSNSVYFGGGMRIAPNADVHDGLLDITLVSPVTRGTLLRLLPRLFDGSFVRHPAVRQIRAHSIRIDGEGMLGEGDGEVLGVPPLTIEAVPGALHVVRPRPLVPERVRPA
ncbi:diacylglycerol/lipid kinase family protein [Aestuariimicrobium ganziense]|uniref:diacylglycerol/lipid kinase family protein n=1 Tax=Aestuariimicrobium ganziense TaxID=2773677 RepID=UPI001941EC3B|nr:YegS/Rv2252/BmrU family lipid kinase [Aestuariimicrobium ganziense]